MATGNLCGDGAKTRCRHTKIAREIGLRTQHRLISVSPRNNLCIVYASASRTAGFVSLSTVIHGLKP